MLLFAAWLAAVLMLETDSLLLFVGRWLLVGVGGKLMMPCRTVVSLGLFSYLSYSAPSAAP